MPGLYADSTNLGLVILPWRYYTKATGDAGVAVSIAPGSVSATSLTRSTTTATFTATASHRLIDRQYVTIAGADLAEYNGTFKITVTGLTTFTYTLPSTPSANASGTITASYTAYAQEAIIMPTSSEKPLTIGPDGNADLPVILQDGDAYRLTMPGGAKFLLSSWYVKSTQASASFGVLFV